MKPWWENDAEAEAAAMKSVAAAVGRHELAKELLEASQPEAASEDKLHVMGPQVDGTVFKEPPLAHAKACGALQDELARALHTRGSHAPGYGRPPWRRSCPCTLPK